MHGDGVRDRVIDRDELERERTGLDDVALGDLDRRGFDAVFLELGLEQRQREPRAVDGDVLAFAEEVGHGTDVVLVRVREDERIDGRESFPDEVEVGEDQIDTGLRVLGEENSTVDDEQSIGVLEHRHVAPDVAEPPERNDAQTVGRERRRRTELDVSVAHATKSKSVTPPSASDCSSA